MTFDELLEYLRGSDLSLSIDGDRIRLMSPTAEVRGDVLACLKEHRGKLIDLYLGTKVMTPVDVPCARLTQQELDVVQGRYPDMERIYIATPLQQGMIFHSLSDSTGAAYCSQSDCEISGQLDIPTFTKAWRLVISRHAALRTCFVWRDIDEMHQVVCARVPFNVVEEDWTHHSVESMDDDLDAWRRADRERGFNVEKVPLMRIGLLHLPGNRHHCIWSRHHALLDGWCTPVVFAEVMSCYEALVIGGVPRLIDPTSYENYVNWLCRRDVEAATSFWRGQLEEVEAPTPLVIAKNPVPEPDLGTGNHFVKISAELCKSLESLARRAQCTLSVVLQAAWSYLLHSYSGESSVVFGSVISGRPADLDGIETMLGLFINTIPVRVQLSKGQCVGELLTEIHKSNVLREEYGYLPLTQLQRLSRIPPGTPLFDSLFMFANYPTAPTIATESALEVKVKWTGPEGESTFPIVLLAQFDGRLAITLRYRTERFGRAAIERMGGHIETILTTIGKSNLARPVHEISLLSAAEERHLLSQWNDTHEKFAEGEFVQELFEEQVRQCPDAIALCSTSGNLSYRQLNSRANRLARYLIEIGVGPETLVALCVDRSPEMVVGILGILKAGGAYIPIDPSYPTHRIGYMLEDSGARVVVTRRCLATSVPMGQQASVVLDDETFILGGCDDDANPSRRDTGLNANNLVYVIYTSGSTGNPKGVMVEHKNFTNLIQWYVREYGFSAADRSLVTTSVAFDMTQRNLLAPLTVGGRVQFQKTERYDSRGLLEQIETEGTTILNCPPSAFPPLLEATGANSRLRGLRWVLLGGEHFDYSRLKVWFSENADVTRLSHMYGPAEGTAIATVYQVPAYQLLDGRMPIGGPIANVRVYVLQPSSGRLAPIGITGELYIGGVGVARGYLGRPDLTAEKFVPDPFGAGVGERLYQTGDLARRLPDGKLELVGRVDQQVKIRGFRVELAEVQSQLCANHEVAEAVVVASEGRNGEKYLVAYVVSGAASGLTDGGSRRRFLVEIRAKLRTRVPEYMIPTAFILIPSVPLTSSGKIDRRALPAPSDCDFVREEYEAPRDVLEATLSSMFRDTLGCGELGIHDNFFVLGGHSLLAMAFTNKLQALLCDDVPTSGIFLAPSVAQFSEYLLENFTSALVRKGLVADGALQGRGLGARSHDIGQSQVEEFRRSFRRRKPGWPSGLGLRRPIAFLLSSPCCGSERVRAMLDGNPRLVVSPPIDLLSFETLAERAASLGDGTSEQNGMLELVMLLRRCPRTEALKVIEDLKTGGMTTLEFYQRLQEWADDRLLIDGTATYAMDYEVLRRAGAGFLDARYIHVVRHPIGAIAAFETSSIREHCFRQRPTLSRGELGELCWLTSQQNIRDFVNGISGDRYLRVTFEELVADADNVADRICRFLSVPGNPGMAIARGRARGRSGHIVRFPSLTKGDSIGELTWHVAADLGYMRERSGTSKPVQALQKMRRDDNVPSYAQQRLWFIDQLEGGSAGYIISGGLRAEGELDVESVRRALDEIVARHEVLRTSIVEQEGRPVQVIKETAGVQFEERDLSGLEEAERERELYRLMGEHARKRFDLSCDVLLRVWIVKLSVRNHAVLFGMHHIASDGWSLGILIKEFTHLYPAYRAGRASELPALKVQYADYAQWQRQWLQGELLDRHLGYWEEQLRGIPQMHSLPLDKPRPAQQGYEGGCITERVDERLSTRIKTACRERDVTLFMFMQAAFALLLSRYSGERDIVMGTPVAGRQHVDVEPLIGFFVNTLVLRTQLDEEECFSELLERSKRMILDAFEHQAVPFEMLVERLQPQRSLSHGPLFQIMFGVQNTEEVQLELPGLRMSGLAGERNVAKFDLDVSVSESDGTLQWSWSYNSGLFEHATIERMMKNFAVLLHSIVEDPQRGLYQLNLLSDQEKRQLRMWNETTEEYPTDVCVHELFEEQVRRNGQSVAVVCGKEQLRYEELNRLSNQLAHYLLEQGIKPDDLVALCVERSPEMMVGLLGILKAGGAYVPIDPTYPSKRIEYLLHDCGAGLVVTQRGLVSGLPLTGQTVVCLEDQALLQRYSQENPGRERTGLQPHHLAYVIYTSGSTGHPKGVMVEHDSISEKFHAWKICYKLDHDVRNHLQTASIGFDVFSGDVFRALCSGGKLVVCPTEQLLDRSEIIRLLQEAEIHFVELVPAVLRNLLGGLNERDHRVRALRYLVVGSDQWGVEDTRKTLSRLPSGTTFLNSYGLTEATVDSTFHIGDGRWHGPCANEAIGRPMANVTVYVLNEQQCLQPIGAPGELYIGGKSVSRGYLHRAELTAQRFLPDPIGDGARGRIYRTGDLVRYMNDGTLVLLGRTDNQIKIRGFRIEPGEIEAHLKRGSGVADAVVTACNDMDQSPYLVAYVVVASPTLETDEARQSFWERIETALRDVLPNYMMPSRFVLLNSIPLTPNGKTDRAALPAPGNADFSRPPHVAPVDELEEILCEIWRKVLRQQTVGALDNFFLLGGHSLSAAVLASAVGARIQVRVPVRTVFECPTVRELGKWLRDERKLLRSFSGGPLPEGDTRLEL